MESYDLTKPITVEALVITCTSCGACQEAPPEILATLSSIGDVREFLEERVATECPRCGGSPEVKVKIPMKK